MTLAQFIPGLITLPVAAVSMLAVAVHLLMVERHTRNQIRRRIRMANGWIMLIAIPLCAAGFSYIDPNIKPRMFMIVWICVIGLVSMSIALAMSDIVNTMIAARRKARELRQTKQILEASLLRSLQDGRRPERADAE
mgnify:CR=1 FL=1|jgi:small-conductance mechanosensitive channel